MTEPRKGWAWRVLVALDRFFNAVFLGRDTETLSSRWHRGCTEKKDCQFCWRFKCAMCWVLDKIDPGHCEKSAGV